ncbi:fibronectin type III domain-containing protein [Candidatus Microgenomates bacterium]|nr:fibronectin type III domain-containing protein [Candidatus Microgenomates bacterium]
MTSFFNKFKIPTLLGLGIIIAGTVAGVYLVAKEEAIFSTQASPQIVPKKDDVIFTNIEDQSVVVSWQTSQAAPSFITFGLTSPNEQAVLDDRDSNPAPDGAGPKARPTHYVTLKNLQPQTRYVLKIVSGKHKSETFQFNTAKSATSLVNLNPVIGTVLDGEIPLDDGIVYLTISGTSPQSALVKTGGNFLIPLSKINKSDLSGTYQPNGEEIGKLTVVSDKGEASAIFKLTISGQILPPLKLGQNLDLTEPVTAEDLNKFDLNNDGQINANDHAIVLKNFGPLRPPSREAGSEASKNPQEKRADINSDGVVDQKDLDLIAQEIERRGGILPQL